MSGSVVQLQQPAEPPPLPAAEPVPRKLTAARLFGALMRDSRFREIRLFQDQLPYGAEVVLKAVCGLVAASPEPGVYRPAAAIVPQLTKVIGHKLKKIDAEADVGSDLDRLVAVGVVEVVDGGLALPVDVAALTAPAPPKQPRKQYSEAELAAMTPSQIASVVNGKKGGRPRKVAFEGQRELAVHGVVGGTQAETREGRRVSEPTGPAPELGGDPGFLAGAPAEAAAQDDPGSSEQQQPHADGRGNLAPNPAENPAGNPPTETRDLEPSEPGGRVLLEATARIAVALGLRRQQIRDGDPDMVAGWLDLGLSVDRMVEIAAARRTSNERRAAQGRKVRPIGSLSFLEPAMHDEAGARPSSLPLAAGAAPAVAPAAVVEEPYDPVFAAALAQLRQGWMDGAVVYQVGVVVRAVLDGDLDQARIRFDRLKDKSGRAAGLVREKYPQLRDEPARQSA